MPARHLGSSRQVRPQRRKLIWSTFDQTVTLAAGINNSVDLLAGLELAGSSVVGCTVIRTHVYMSFTVASLGDGLSYGLIIGRHTDIGSVRVNPNADPELDWMLIGKKFASTNGATVNTVQELWIDNHSKRKIEELGQAYLLALTNLNAVANASPRVFARSLVALP